MEAVSALFRAYVSLSMLRSPHWKGRRCLLLPDTRFNHHQNTAQSASVSREFYSTQAEFPLKKIEKITPRRPETPDCLHPLLGPAAAAAARERHSFCAAIKFEGLL